MDDEVREKLKEQKQLIRQWLQQQNTLRILHNTFVAISDEADETASEIAVLNKYIGLKVGALPKKK